MTEYGFYHPSRGYWQTNSDVPDHILATYPECTVEVPLKPGANYDWDGSEWISVPPDPAQQKETFRQAIQSHIDATAQSRNYDNGMALAGYVNSTIAPWKAEAEAFIAWRDQVWLFVFEKLAQVEAGEIPPPESAEALIGWLPQIEWPA